MPGSPEFRKLTILEKYESRKQEVLAYAFFKAEVHLKAVFTPPKIGLTEISRSRFKQYFEKPYTHYTNQCFGVFCKFFGDF